MANTKGMDRQERKRVKRRQRRELHRLFNKMTKKEKARFRRSDEKGLKSWLIQRGKL